MEETQQLKGNTPAKTTCNTRVYATPATTTCNTRVRNTRVCATLPPPPPRTHATPNERDTHVCATHTRLRNTPACVQQPRLRNTHTRVCSTRAHVRDARSTSAYPARARVQHLQHLACVPSPPACRYVLHGPSLGLDSSPSMGNTSASALSGAADAAATGLSRAGRGEGAGSKMLAALSGVQKQAELDAIHV
eukprot:358152-Chlamydomonas_euryale.AAC.8